MLIDDFAGIGHMSNIGSKWHGISDKVMGGMSEANVSYSTIKGRSCLRLFGDVRLQNNGGFIQVRLDLSTEGNTFNASNYTGVRLLARGNGEIYSINLRTPDNIRVWQSYRSQFCVGSNWEEVEIPFASFVPHRVDKRLDASRLRRIGLIAIGRAFKADVALGKIEFY